MSKINLREMKEQAEKESLEVESEQRTKLTPRVVSFSIEYDSPTGETYQDTLKSKVMDGEARLIKNRVFSQLVRGTTLESLPLDERLRLEAIARVTAQVVNPPEWFNEWCVQDVDLLKGVNDLLLDHERMFLQSNTRTSKTGERRTRVSISCNSLEETGTAE